MRASKELTHEQLCARLGPRARPGLLSTPCARASMRTKPWRTAHSCKGHARAGRRWLWPQPRRAGQRGPHIHAHEGRVCERDWRWAGGGGGSGSILRGRDWIWGKAASGIRFGWQARSREDDLSSRAIVRRAGAPHLRNRRVRPGRSTRPRFATGITALRARDGGRERFGHRGTWGAGSHLDAVLRRAHHPACAPVWKEMSADSRRAAIH